MLKKELLPSTMPEKGGRAGGILELVNKIVLGGVVCKPSLVFSLAPAEQQYNKFTLLHYTTEPYHHTVAQYNHKLQFQ